MDSNADVYDWLMNHHTTVTSGECCGKMYHIFAVTDFPVFGSKCEYISTTVGIPLGPLSLAVRDDSLPRRESAFPDPLRYPLFSSSLPRSTFAPTVFPTATR